MLFIFFGFDWKNREIRKPDLVTIYKIKQLFTFSLSLNIMGIF